MYFGGDEANVHRQLRVVPMEIMLMELFGATEAKAT
jgi:hypothetical protein